MAIRDEQPTSLRLTKADLSRAETIRAATAKESAIDITRHQVLIAALRLGLDAMERKRAPASRPRRD